MYVDIQVPELPATKLADRCYDISAFIPRFQSWEYVNPKEKKRGKVKEKDMKISGQRL